MGIQRWWVYKSLWQRIGAMTIPQFGQICSIFWLFWPWQGIRLTLLDLGKFLPALDNPSRYGEVDVSQKNAKMKKKWNKNLHENAWFFSRWHSKDSVHAAFGPGSQRARDSASVASSHWGTLPLLPWSFCLGPALRRKKKTQKLQQNYPGKRPQTVWRE